MPTYEYRCTECGHEFEIVQKFSDDALEHCPQCEGRLRKVFNAVGVVFKGSGFYRTDSRDADAKKGSSGAKDGGKDSGKESSGSGTEAASTSGGSGDAKPKSDSGAAASSSKGSSGSGASGGSGGSGSSKPSSSKAASG